MVESSDPSMRTVTVELGDDRTYPVHVGRGAVTRLAELIPERSRRVAIVTQSGIPHTIDTGRDQRVFVIVDGEASKTLSTIESLCESFAEWNLTRADAVIVLGGGLVTDVAGCAASVYPRGLRFI